MRKLKIESLNTSVDVSTWGNVYINGDDIQTIIYNNIEVGQFRAKVTIIIEEVSADLNIESNKTDETEEESENE